MHSVICLFIFSGIGLGLYGGLQRHELYIVVAGICLFQLIASPIWLRHYRFGPLEWAWRSLTYRKKLGFRKLLLESTAGNARETRNRSYAMIAKSPLELTFGDVFYEMNGILSEAPVYVKLEGFHMGRSIKIKPAIAMIEDLEQRGLLQPESKLVESSSGNMGLALSIVCSAKGYDFTCVSDPNISEPTRNLIELHGGRVVIVDQRDSNRGFLNTRIELIERWLEEDPTLIWINQYANPLNKSRAHTINRTRDPERIPASRLPLHRSRDDRHAHGLCRVLRRALAADEGHRR